MHAGKIESSARLKNTLAALRQGWISTRDIAQQTGSMAVHSEISALRENGIDVESRIGAGRIWYYRLRNAG